MIDVWGRLLARPFGRHALLRNLQAGSLLEDFLLAAVAAVLVIRLYFEIAFGYLAPYAPLPGQLATDELHIAHMLWGGLLMLVGFIIAFVFLGRPALQLAAVIGGIGFGAFIDELGKFITRDNNYFYEPAIALIYLMFVALFIGVRAVQRPWTLSEHAALANALTYVQQAITRDIRPEDKQRALDLLDRCDQTDPIVTALRETLLRAEPATPPARHVVRRARDGMQTLYERFVRTRWFSIALIAIFVSQSIGSLYQTFVSINWSLTLVAVLLAGALAAAACGPRRLRSSTVVAWEIVVLAVLVGLGILLHLQEPPASFARWMQLLAPTVASLLVAYGILTLRRSLLDACWIFHHAVLINILVTQVFAFNEDQFTAVTGLLVHILVLLALRFIMGQEQMKQMRQRQEPATSGGA